MAVATGPDIDGVGKGAGAAGAAAGVAGAGVELGALWGAGSGLCCPKQGNAAIVANNTARKQTPRVRKNDLLSWYKGTIPNRGPAFSIRKTHLISCFNGGSLRDYLDLRPS